jgi:hypothetical protein
VLIRLDERGGTDEPTPWAMSAPFLQKVTTSLRSQDAIHAEDNVFISLEDSVGGDDATASFTAVAIEPAPPARGAATVYVIRPDGDLIGRDEKTCTLVIAERSVSRRHSRVVVKAENGAPVLSVGAEIFRSGEVIAFNDVRCLLLSTTSFCDLLPRLAHG